MQNIHQGAFVNAALADGVATVIWSRPERRNAIGREVAAELAAALQAVAARADAAVAVLRSAEGLFCSGWDVNDFKDVDRTADPSTHAAFFEPGRRLLGCISDLPQISIAAPAGAVLGFGCSLLARCDFAIACEDVELSLPEIRRGMPPATVLPEILAVMPQRAALLWAVTGARYDARTALRDGLLTGVAPRAAHAEEVQALARTIAAHGAELVRETKALSTRLAAAAPGERVRLGVAAAVERMRRAGIS